jgi:hypothetical protein
VAREALVAADRQIANQARSRGVFESNRLNERLGDILAGGFPANDVGSPTWVAMARQIQQSRWAHLLFQLRPGAYNDETLIEFLSELHQLEQQRPVVLIWDVLPAHHSGRMLAWLASQCDWF